MRALITGITGQDGSYLAEHLLEKEYEVLVDKDLKDHIAKKMSAGVDIEGYMTKPAKVKKIGNRSSTHW